MKPQFSFIQFTIAFVAGIILGDACCGFVSAWVWLVLFVLSAVVCFVFRNIPVKGTIAIVCGCLLGCLIISLHEQNSNVSLPQKKVYYEGVVVSKPVETGKATDTDLSLYETIKLKAKKIRQRLVEGMSSEISDSEFSSVV